MVGTLAEDSFQKRGAEDQPDHAVHFGGDQPASAPGGPEPSVSPGPGGHGADLRGGAPGHPAGNE